MTKLTVLTLLVLGMIGVAPALVGPLASHALAEDDKGGAAAGGNATSYDFEDDLVQGDLVRPDGENLMVRRRGARESLIKIREHFVPELLKSVENL